MAKRKKTKFNQIMWWVSFIFVAVFFAWAHKFTYPLFSDDSWFSVMLDDTSLFKYLLWRYNNWTSRLLIEALEVSLTRVDFLVWQALDVIMILLLIWGICELTNAKYALAPLWFAGLLCLVPVGILYQAGWVSTSVNYIWTLTAAVMALLPLKGKGNRIVSLLFLIFACNQEQMAVVLLAIFIIYFISERKLLLPEILVIVLSIIWIVTCPGNKARTAMSYQNDFPGYEYMSVLDKLKIGILDAASFFPAGGAKQIILIVFMASVTVVILYKVFGRESLGQFYGLLSVLLTGILVFIGFPVRHMVEEGKILNDPYLYNLFENRYIADHEYCIYEEKNVNLEIIIYLILFALILFLLFKACSSVKEGIIISLLFAIALGSKVMLGFTPSVYVSGYRPAFPGSVIILSITFYLLNKLPNKIKHACFACILLVSVFMFRYIVPGETF
ncbi:MAG: hypothetical protein J6U37_02400 [Lachnospiraceae bacterium]|nr:hypothetical protein [Lachnospiraceae bacterium]